MLTRWNDGRWSRDPAWGAFRDLRREMDMLFRDYDRALDVGPRMELEDQGEALLVRMELPGFTEDDLSVDLNRSMLTIRGQRSTEVPEGYTAHRRERGAMSFARSVSLPCRVEADQVTATLTDGVLELCLPKAAEEQPRKIEIRPAS